RQRGAVGDARRPLGARPLLARAQVAAKGGRLDSAGGPWSRPLQRAGADPGSGDFRSRGRSIVISDRLLAVTLRLGAGWVMWLLVALSMLSVTVMVERALYFGSRRMSKVFPRLLELCSSGDLKGAAALATSDSMESEVVRAAANVAEGGTPAVEKAVQSTID